jgi:hypothetical protein
MFREARRTKSPLQSTFFAREEQGNTAKPHNNTQDFSKPVAGPQRSTSVRPSRRIGRGRPVNRLFTNWKSARCRSGRLNLRVTRPIENATGSASPAPPVTSGDCHVRTTFSQDLRQKLKSRFAVAYQPPPSPRSRIQPADTPSFAAPTAIPVRCEPTRN